MEIIDLSESYHEQYFCCLEDWSDEIKEAIKVENEIRKANKKDNMDSIEEDELVSEWLENKAMRLSIFVNTGLGGYSFAGEKAKSDVDIQKADVNGYITKEDGEKRWLLPNEKKAMNTLANIVAYAPIAPSDLMSVAAKSYSKISKKSVTYDQYKRYNKIKKMYDTEPEGLEDMIRSGMNDLKIKQEIYKRTGIKPNEKAGN